ncbi:MAG: hypothetical protein HZC28_12795 [Spirochaetes bacterium]|nr:hypothetical protein [Spirochaetota bacterium]
MSRNILIRFIVAACTALSVSGAGFHMTGWEYDRPLVRNGRPYIADNRDFLEAASIDGALLLFTLSGPLLIMHTVENGTIVDSKKLFPVDPFTRTVIHSSGGGVFILAFQGGQGTVYRITGRTPQRLYKCEHRTDAGDADITVSGNEMFITFPVKETNRIVPELVHIKIDGTDSRATPLNLPPFASEDKGIFFPRIYRDGAAYRVFYIARRYDSTKKYLRDVLQTVALNDIALLPQAVPEQLSEIAVSDHPPEYIVSGGTAAIMFSSKRQALYSLRWFSLPDKKEYAVSPPFANAFRERFFAANGIITLFYILQTSGKYTVMSRTIDAARARYAEHWEREQSNHTVIADDVRTFALAEKGGIRYFFYIDAAGAIRYSATDRSARSPVPRLVCRSNVSPSAAYYDIVWDEPDDPSGISGYAFVIDTIERTVPDVKNLYPADLSVGTKDYSNGRYVFHIVSIDTLGNRSPAAHCPFTMPAMPVFIPEPPIAAVQTVKRIPAPRSKAPPASATIPKRTAELPPAPAVDIESRRLDAFIAYISAANGAIRAKDYFTAEKNIALAALIYPERPEVYVLLQSITLARRGLFYNGDFTLIAFSSCIGGLILLLASIFIVLTRIRSTQRNNLPIARQEKSPRSNV